ncbi:MAG: hypothetical protein MUO38_03665, partial [Anaerolineales bacterium]|nr:hypothetical protein [Anaerolineales bacterium]
AYEDFFGTNPAGQVLILDTNTLDFVARPEHLAYVVDRIRDTLGLPPYQPELPLKGGNLG